MVLWAFVLTALVWTYVCFASLWFNLFDRGIVKTGTREEMGYRIGAWKVYWRLPTRAAIVILLFSITPILTLLLNNRGLTAAILTIMTGMILLLWLTNPPGMIIGFVDKSKEKGQLVLEPKIQRNHIRSVLVLAIFGLIPALGIGATFTWLVARLGS